MKKAIVFQSDFGTNDGAVSAMYGVALGVDEDLRLYDLSHEIRQYDIWEASYRLFQTVQYWGSGTVFVSVVDPGVGSARKSVVAKTRDGHYIVTPDNGTLTHIKRFVGIDEVREIDESVNRRKNTELSYTFHGRDVYAYTGARLAAGIIDLSGVGRKLAVQDVLELPLGEVVSDGASVTGCIDVLDGRFGSLWTNIPQESFLAMGVSFGDRVEVTILNDTMLVYQNRIAYGRSFADVNVGEPIIYGNSLYRMAVAINQGHFARAYNVGTGTHWHIRFKKV